MPEPQNPCLTSTLMGWYKQHKRSLPWRDDPEPYNIWVSEIMLQQTRVEAVVPLYLKFMERFPRVDDLADADEDTVLSVWQGLGYYSRARRLHAAARTIVHAHGGALPEAKDQLLQLPGIGPYTAAAIASMAFGRPEVALDGNLLRVGARLFAITEDITLPRTKRQLEELLAAYLPLENPGDFNQALMDLGSGICVPRRPRCDQCPLVTFCAAHRQGITAELPKKSPKKPPISQTVRVMYIETSEHILLRQRNHGGFLQGMWEMPWFSVTTTADTDATLVAAERPVAPEYAHLEAVLGLGLPHEIRTAEYVFSHRHWHMNIYCYTVEQITPAAAPAEGTTYRWHRKKDLHRAALPTVFQRILPSSLRSRG